MQECRSWQVYEDVCINVQLYKHLAGYVVVIIFIIIIIFFFWKSNWSNIFRMPKKTCFFSHWSKNQSFNYVQLKKNYTTIKQ